MTHHSGYDAPVPKGHPEPLDVRFWQYVPQDRSVEACWEWAGSRCGRSGHGGSLYGRISGHREDGSYGDFRAHRVSWLVHNGPIPDGLQVLHTCDNPPCVNPAHLFLGTPKSNAEDRVRKGRNRSLDQAAKGEVCAAKLTDEVVREIRRLRDGGASWAAMARVLGVDPSTVGDAGSGRTWRHVRDGLDLAPEQ